MVAVARPTISPLSFSLLAASWCALPAAQRPPGIPVFYGGLNESSCFRIPTIIKTHLGTLLAFAENRFSNCDDMGSHALVVRRSFNSGVSWGPLIQVAVNLRAPCDGCTLAISNPNPVEVDFHNGTYAILVHFDTYNNPRQPQHGIDMQIWSRDDGLTWGEASMISFPPQPNVGGLIGPSIGIQSQNGTIYFSACSMEGHFLYWSRDFGNTWASSPGTPGLDGEASIAFLRNHADASDETIIMNVRRDGKQHRQQILWKWTTPATGEWTDMSWPEGMVDPDCQGSIVNDNGIVYLSNNAETGDRSHLSLKQSSDEGGTWDTGRLIWGGPSAYSQLVVLGEETLMGVLFEAGFDSPYEGIWFAQVPLKTATRVFV